MHIIILRINRLPVTDHIDILFTDHERAGIIKFRMRITKAQGIFRHTCIRAACLFYLQIRINHKCPAQISGLIINQIRESSHRIISFIQPAFISCQQICIICSITSPSAPSVRRIKHIRKHLYIILSFPVTHGSSSSSGIRNTKLSQTIMAVQDPEHGIRIMLAFLCILLHQGKHTDLQGRTGNHTIFKSKFSFCFKISLRSHQLVNRTLG